MVCCEHVAPAAGRMPCSRPVRDPGAGLAGEGCERWWEGAASGEQGPQCGGHVSHADGVGGGV